MTREALGCGLYRYNRHVSVIIGNWNRKRGYCKSSIPEFHLFSYQINFFFHFSGERLINRLQGNPRVLYVTQKAVWLTIRYRDKVSQFIYTLFIYKSKKFHSRERLIFYFNKKLNYYLIFWYVNFIDWP